MTSALVGGEWSASRPGRFTPRERAHGTHWIGGWVGPWAGLDDMEKWRFLPPPGLEFRSLGRPARSQSLYRLRYPGSLLELRYSTLIQDRKVYLGVHKWLLAWNGVFLEKLVVARLIKLLSVFMEFEIYSLFTISQNATFPWASCIQSRTLHSISLKWNFILSLHCIGTGYGLDDRPWGRSSSPGRVKNFHSSMSFRPALGLTQPPIQWVPGALSPGVKRPGRVADDSPPVSAEIKKMWIYIRPLPHTPSRCSA
jgi:hypothetical protein